MTRTSLSSIYTHTNHSLEPKQARASSSSSSSALAKSTIYSAHDGRVAHGAKLGSGPRHASSSSAVPVFRQHELESQHTRVTKHQHKHSASLNIAPNKDSLNTVSVISQPPWRLQVRCPVVSRTETIYRDRGDDVKTTPDTGIQLLDGETTPGAASGG
jgi:hypothetical protein